MSDIVQDVIEKTLEGLIENVDGSKTEGSYNASRPTPWEFTTELFCNGGSLGLPYSIDIDNDGT